MENSQPKIVKYIAHLLSYVLHPLFIPTYFFLFLMQVLPFEFVGITEWQLKMRLFSVAWLTAFFPAFAVFLLWRLKLSDSIFLRTQKERIIPYVITMFFYWWMYYLSRNFTDQPIALKFFYLGIFVASAIGMTVNNFMKVSLHAMGIAGLTTAVILVSVFYPVNNAVWVLLAVLLTALVISARLVVSDHTKKELIVGLFIGVFTQVAAYLWVV
ncbi:MAG: hypothetical protein K9H79_01540 [Chitinophagaceae bacterium]|nr:hypothetical protein [Chitinophagaceae bacterium]MCF8421579.1 hypothetical protein [Chitinophagaceae bacterium]